MTKAWVVFLAVVAFAMWAEGQDLECPDVDVLFVFDTSASLDEEGEQLCSAIASVLAQVRSEGIVVDTSVILSITDKNDAAIECLQDSVQNLFGSEGTVGNDPCPWPTATSNPFPNHPEESWAPASAILSQKWDWNPGNVRLIIPISDEGPCGGNPVDSFDTDSVINAVSVANANHVIVSPIVASGTPADVRAAMFTLANGTNGIVSGSENIAQNVVNIIKAACTISEPCPDAPICDVPGQSLNFSTCECECSVICENENHVVSETCQCECPDIDIACSNDDHVRNTETCQCECPNIDIACSNDDHLRNTETCQCECPNIDIACSNAGHIRNSQTCQCECPNIDVACTAAGHIRNPETCQCECANIDEACPTGKVRNQATCQCECANTCPDSQTQNADCSCSDDEPCCGPKVINFNFKGIIPAKPCKSCKKKNYGKYRK